MAAPQDQQQQQKEEVEEQQQQVSSLNKSKLAWLMAWVLHDDRYMY